MLNSKGKLDYEAIFNFFKNKNIGIHFDDIWAMTDMKIIKNNNKVIDVISPNELIRLIEDELIERHSDMNLSDFYKDSIIVSPSFHKKFNRYNVESFRDSEECIHMFFNNGVLKVFKDTFEFLKWDSFDLGNKFIWRNTVSKRDFDIKLIDNYKDSDWYRFCSNAVTTDGIEPLMQSIGYMLHTFKDPSNTSIIVFGDANENFLEANGGSGKSLIANTALSKLRKTTYIEGKNFNQDSQFKFQTIDLQSQIVVIDDVKKDFRYETLYNATTNDYYIEGKFKQPVFMPFEKSQKWIITTNWGIYGQGDSDKRRRIVIGFSDHYNKENRPIKEFKKRFFTDWNENDFNDFYSFFAYSAQLYLNKGLEEFCSNQVDRKAINAVEGSDFVNFIIDNVSNWIGYDRRQGFDDIIGLIPGELKKESIEKTKRSFTRVVEFLGFDVKEERTSIGGISKRYKWLDQKGNNTQFFKPKNNDLPF